MRIKMLALATSFISSTALTAMPAAYAQAPIARQASFNIAAGDLVAGLRAYSRQARVELIFNAAELAGRKTGGVKGTAGTDEALRRLISGARVEMVRDPSGAYLIRPVGNVSAAPVAEAPVPASIPAQYDEIIVTAQRREEKMIDVPIAMTALTGNALDDRKIEGGPELLRAIPNVSFTKTNFSMYNFTIRGIGTQSISASSDPAVAVSFNSTPLVRNRLFEAEFFDLNRIEILRGPQGTLYGRNATAGVVNMLPALPEPEFGGAIKGETGNYKTRRLSGMLNMPIGDTLGVRVAGMMTKRDGYDYNAFFGTRINDRDLWATRATVAWEPNDRFKANVIWQHYEEDDQRSRSAKQLCTPDPGPEKIGSVTIDAGLRGRISQGCLPGSLYDDAAYGKPNSAALVYLYFPHVYMSVGNDSTRTRIPATIADPMGGGMQSRNLREIESNYDPIFRAKNDVVQFNWEYRPSDTLQFISQTAYSRDRFYSSQDYNRFVTEPMFADSSSAVYLSGMRLIDKDNFPGPTPGGVYCDYQLGCSDRMVSADLSRSKNRQWSQEFRLQSSFDGPMNFLLGANYLDFKSQDDYYVFNNMFTYIAQWEYSRAPIIPAAPGYAGEGWALRPCELGNEDRECPYADTNPITSLNDQGHNYFLSKNGVHIRSRALFGELYWNVSESLKVTVGARYTKDKKRADQIPSQLLLGGGRNKPDVLKAIEAKNYDLANMLIGDFTGGRFNSGYPAQDDINLSWGKFTGRVVLDWKPDLRLTDDTLIYASVSRGYKGGGVNPPRIDFNPNVVQFQFLPQTFRPEYVNAFEIGTKNSFGGGRFTLNATGFFYDYKDFQVSQIVDRIAYNENFNATSWGLELEAAWRPSRAFRADGNLGYLRTRLGKGAQSIDVMNRTQGDPDWVVLRPWLQVPSNCIAPRALVEQILKANAGGLIPKTAGETAQILSSLCPGGDRYGSWNPERPVRLANLNFWNPNRGSALLNPAYGITYDPFAPYNPATVGALVPYDPANPDAWIGGTSGAPNGGRGFYAQLEGNELPNAPRLTMNVGAQYTFLLDNGDWELTFRGDYYRQSKSFGRVYNTEFDRLRAWDNMNIAVTLTRPQSDLTFQLYVKNAFKKMPITGFFVNSDDNGLTTNVFTPDPRIFGFSGGLKF